MKDHKLRRNKIKLFIWIQRNPEKYGNNNPALDALLCFSPFWITSLVIIYLFISGIANAQTPQQTPLSPYGVCAPASNLNLYDKIDYLEKRIARLEKIIKEHIDKPHVYFGERPKGFPDTYGYLYIEDYGGNKERISN